MATNQIGKDKRASITLNTLGGSFDSMKQAIKARTVIRRKVRPAKRSKTRVIKEDKIFNLRNEIIERGTIHCLSFSTPLMDFGYQNDSDDEDFGQMEAYPSIVGAKRKWKKLAAIVLD